MAAKVRMVDLEAELPTVELRPVPPETVGREIHVMPIDAVCAELKEEYDETKKPALLWKIAARVLPEATEDEIKRLSIAECSWVIQIASGKSQALLDAIKAEGEEAKKKMTATPEKAPDPRPEIGSPSSSQA